MVERDCPNCGERHFSSDTVCVWECRACGRKLGPELSTIPKDNPDEMTARGGSKPRNMK